MENFSIERTRKSPEINFNFSAGTLVLKGCSTPENATDFFRPLAEAIDRYSYAPNPVTEVTVHLDYFNTSSSKMIFMLFKKLSGIHKNGSTVTINWCYEDGDDDMLEAGQDYESILEIPFNMVLIPE
jgi:hypothetical protein